jgi:hypothetical protein
MGFNPLLSALYMTCLFLNDRLAWPETGTPKKSVRAVNKMTNLRRLIQEHGDTSAVPYLDMLVDLISGMLRYEPGILSCCACLIVPSMCLLASTSAGD